MELDPARGYDFIGDIHGCGKTLEHLLSTLGYRIEAGVWRHPQRMAIFVGDLIDRGPHIRETLHLVHDMVRAGSALCIMGNHEFNALGWSTPAPAGSGRHYVREHSPRHRRLIQQTLEQFEAYGDEWQGFLDWFYELPLFIDAGRFRVVHACWDQSLIDPLRAQFPNACIDEAFLQESAIPGNFANTALDRLLRGTDMRLPGDMTLTSNDGFTRSYFRTKFWEENPQTYGDIVFQPDALPELAAQIPLSESQKTELLKYPDDQPMLFVGHYWRRGKPTAIRPNLACLDYSAVLKGKLVAYRLDQENRIDSDKFVWVNVEGPEARP
ncbi:metallophosphoesterase [Pseudomonas sp. 5P_3.1_Bac2]|uniref:metallophosphoesterase n=1 Tax=Pseudomonas sp. 5P_3.1_Bac2 TaxID=2971617 RepID=UPI0021C615C8|nr:metallophosphoesterase [Pseudomonas sp. 5P_3.1_Bac2]MCU1716041.1 metallophosphoesterase [Pseudomonas sp. 5P_3.1_Bac2]